MRSRLKKPFPAAQHMQSFASLSPAKVQSFRFKRLFPARRGLAVSPSPPGSEPVRPVREAQSAQPPLVSVLLAEGEK